MLYNDAEQQLLLRQAHRLKLLVSSGAMGAVVTDCAPRLAAGAGVAAARAAATAAAAVVFGILVYNNGEYYGPPQCDAVFLTGWTVTEYYQAPAMVCWPVCRMNQLLGMWLCLWTHGSHGLR